MSSKLRRNEMCPIHHSMFCCGRTANRVARKAYGREVTKYFSSKRSMRKADWVNTAPGVWRIPDVHHPRGYRERRSPAAMRELTKRKCQEQNGLCGICHEALTDFRGIVPDHIDPRGMNGAWRDDHPDNIQAAHSSCNMEKGSKRLGIGE